MMKFSSRMWGIPGYPKKKLQGVDAEKIQGKKYKVDPKLIVVNGVIISIYRGEITPVIHLQGHL